MYNERETKIIRLGDNKEREKRQLVGIERSIITIWIEKRKRDKYFQLFSAL